MKLVKNCLVALALFGSANAANASIVSFSDIAGGVNGITVSDFGGYTYNNFDALLDGNFSTTVASERFTGIGPGLGQNEFIAIAADFDGLYTFETFGIAHDWGNSFSQQISSLTLSVFDNVGTVFSFDYTGLAQNTFNVIDLYNGSIANATGFEVKITALQVRNLEIRELVIGAVKNQAVSVNAPLTGILLVLAASGLFFFRKK